MAIPQMFSLYTVFLNGNQIQYFLVYVFYHVYKRWVDISDRVQAFECTGRGFKSWLYQKFVWLV